MGQMLRAALLLAPIALLFAPFGLDAQPLTVYNSQSEWLSSKESHWPATVDTYQAAPSPTPTPVLASSPSPLSPSMLHALTAANAVSALEDEASAANHADTFDADVADDSSSDTPRNSIEGGSDTSNLLTLSSDQSPSTATSNAGSSLVSSTFEPVALGVGISIAIAAIAGVAAGLLRLLRRRNKRQSMARTSTQLASSPNDNAMENSAESIRLDDIPIAASYACTCAPMAGVADGMTTVEGCPHGKYRNTLLFGQLLGNRQAIGEYPSSRVSSGVFGDYDDIASDADSANAIL
ncbi:hypothetical protein THASP1DRAFT_29074 [Thamnocephalis sphaerospora]|uniref:Uncharacterized protein n=1 Tax=Thamnocephalis sphaerospora TaxID=78915 RepID=A0A4P9XSM3_9FUNG|nr:hypothetical protein THASP1DRAFT_29074 [Thamnocephalis sphaerospora]|eukprot:RKP09135.1 hypothetical protein THASP1DRAFT_29074 [Thamnocephalis sphaerospora]